MRSFRTHLSYANVVATLALFVALGGGAYAAAIGSFVAPDGAIKGCVPRTGGALRVVKAGKRCPKGTVLLTFNAKGQTGAAGATGTQGPMGPMGPAGSNATINGVAAGGDLTGTYPNPTVGAGAVTGAKVAAGTLRLANLAVWSISGGTGGASTAANSCDLFSFGTVSGAQPTDLVIGVNLSASQPLPAGLIPYGVITDTNGTLRGGYCNPTSMPIPIPSGSGLTFYGIR